MFIERVHYWFRERTGRFCRGLGRDKKTCTSLSMIQLYGCVKSPGNVIKVDDGIDLAKVCARKKRII